jgi:hypothetical protein
MRARFRWKLLKASLHKRYCSLRDACAQESVV